jgi:hypothetical protein
MFTCLGEHGILLIYFLTTHLESTKINMKIELYKPFVEKLMNPINILATLICFQRSPSFCIFF